MAPPPPPLPWAWRLALPLVAFVSVPFLLPLTLPFILFLRPGASSSPNPLSFHRLAWLASPQIPSPPPPATKSTAYPPPPTEMTSPSPPPPPPPLPPPLPNPPAIEKKTPCDIYDGTWVRATASSRPLYSAGTCPYVDEAYACAANGRPDSAYTRWRWAPRRCALPPFNATDFLSRLRGRRLVLVGDSMNRNQFESMLCVLRQALPDKSRLVETHGWRISKGRGYFVFKFLDYGCTVAFVRSHFLVREGVRVNRQGSTNPTLQIDRIDKTAGRWKKADVLVFNTGHWWTHGKTARGTNYYKEGDTLYPQFDSTEAYRRALTTWARWVDKNMDPDKTRTWGRGVGRGRVVQRGDGAGVQGRRGGELPGEDEDRGGGDRAYAVPRQAAQRHQAHQLPQGRAPVGLRHGGGAGREEEEEEAGLQPLVPPRRARCVERAHLCFACHGTQPQLLES